MKKRDAACRTDILRNFRSEGLDKLRPDPFCACPSSHLSIVLVCYLCSRFLNSHLHFIVGECHAHAYNEPASSERSY